MERARHRRRIGRVHHRVAGAQRLQRSAQAVGAGSVGAGLVDRGSGVPGGPLAGCHGALRGAEWRVRAERGQQPDAGGSTILDQDTDVIALGACGYACLQYGTPAADNFRFQDGELRDSLDDSMVPRAWLELGRNTLLGYRARLDEIRRRRDYQAAAIVHW